MSRILSPPAYLHLQSVAPVHNRYRLYTIRIETSNSLAGAPLIVTCAWGRIGQQLQRRAYQCESLETMEKLLRRLKRNGTPSSEALRAGAANIRGHLAYIGYLYEDRRWLAGDAMTMADLTAAAHISVLDYLGDVPWEASSGARDWYAKVKSRPAFRPLLMDRITSIKPPVHYDDLDF